MADVINLTVPKSWADLSQEQLRFLYQAMVDIQSTNRNIGFRSIDDYNAQTTAQVATRCLFKWSGLSRLCALSTGWLVSFNNIEFPISTEQIASAISHLSWIKDIPTEPVHLDVVDGANAVPADLSSDFSFDNWLACEAFWQAYQNAQNDNLLRQMAEVLYHKPQIKLNAAELLSVFYWWAAVKAMVSELFPNFFKPSGDNGEVASTNAIRQNMDAQIRALTKGDITKERIVLSMPAIRALTELDAQAREYDELNRKYPTK